jgi:phosphatidylinositol alpha-1,6-mannosyltransferase
VVIGDGPARCELEDLARSLGIQYHVVFLGEVSDTIKFSFYDICEFFVMPNRLLNGQDWEGFGIVFLEAAMAGKPAVGGNNGGVPDAVEHEVTGLLVDTETGAEPTIIAMRRLLENAELRQRMGAVARQRACTLFAWEAIGERFVAHLRDRRSLRGAVG